MGGEAAAPDSGWLARLELAYQRRGARSVLARRSHRGPLLVQRPFYPEGPGTCHSVLLHPPGGVVGGDRLEIDVTVGAGAHALVTTPAAGKFYRSAGPWAEQQVALRVAEGARLEWLPQETICYDGARVRAAVRVELAPGAAFTGWEITCLGFPATGVRFARGEILQRLELHRDGAPLFLERGVITGGSPFLTARWGLAGHAVTATLVCTPGGPELLDPVRSALDEQPVDGLLAATVVGDTLVCRYLGDDAGAARRAFTRAWTVLRRATGGPPAVVPRIWST